LSPFSPSVIAQKRRRKHWRRRGRKERGNMIGIEVDRGIPRFPSLL